MPWKLAIFVAAALTLPLSADRQPLVIGGTVIAPGRVLQNGWVVIEDGRISAVTEKDPRVPGALTVETGGIVLPGFIDLHNHLAWNVLPRWKPPARYANRSAWRNAPEFRTAGNLIDQLRRTHACEMNTYGEIRALVGGVTAVQSSERDPCIMGLARNLDFYSGLYPDRAFDREPLRHELDVGAISEGKADEIVRQIRRSELSALVVHVGEGVRGDPASRDEFTQLVHKRLLGPWTAIVHGTAFGDDEFWAVRELGAALVWSPRSNHELYGETTDIARALDRGIPVALAPDWALTGSSNMLDELRFVAGLNSTQLGGRLTEVALVEMATEVPARIARIDDKVGSIRPGLLADLLVIEGNRSRPHRAVVAARAEDVRLVLIGGEAVYGSPALMRRLGKGVEAESITVCGEPMALDTSAGPGRHAQPRFGALEATLREALARLRPGVAVAPVAECEQAAGSHQRVRLPWADSRLVTASSSAQAR